MGLYSRTLLLLFLLFPALSAHAQSNDGGNEDAAAAQQANIWKEFAVALVTPENWSGNVEGGLNIYSGNTDSTDYRLKGKAVNKHGKWTHTMEAEALNREENDNRTAEKYRFYGRDNYQFSDDFYAFGDLGYTKDRFSGYDYRINETLGLGYIVLSDEIWNVDVRMGIGGEHTKDEVGDHEDSAMAKFATDIEYKFNDNVTLTEKADAIITEDLQTYRSETAIKSRITESLAFKAGYSVERLSSVPTGRKKTDSHTFIGIVYDF